MATLLSVFQLSKSYPHGPLFQGVSFGIQEGDRIGLIGPNGAGKSTLLKILVGVEKADAGEINKKNGLKIGYLPQVPKFQDGATVQDVMMEGVEDRYDWEAISRSQMWASKFCFEENNIFEETPLANLSGGWQKRIGLCRELMKEPDLLLLDEPTNHLDVEGIMWLEEFLANQNQFAVFCITHDRGFLQRISTKIFDLDRKNPDGLLRVDGSYSEYIKVKEDLMTSQQKLELKLKNTWRRESEWLSRGAKARTTKQQARINRAYELEDQVASVSDRNQNRSVQFAFQSVEGGPKKLIEAKDITKKFKDKTIFEKLNLLVTSKSRIGILGPNGIGKSTLLKCLMGELPVDGGSLFLADHIKIASFEQNKESLVENLTVRESVCPQGEHVFFGGKYLHVHGYLEKFLFNQRRIQDRVSDLSGGERSRLLLARLMLQESNLMVLDEPTNDLDLETLHFLEAALSDYTGGIILISHDRMFMDNLCSEIYAFEGGQLERFADVLQWEVWVRERSTETKKTIKKETSEPLKEMAKRKKLSFTEETELKELPKVIEKLESEIEGLNGKIANGGLGAGELQELSVNLSSLQHRLDSLFLKWQDLLDRSTISR